VPGDWPHAAGLSRDFPRPPASDFAAGRVILERAVLHREDLQNDPDTPEITRAWARRMDTRSVLWVPLLREDDPIGVIGVARGEPGLFPDEQVRLLQTFADQAVIAIENVRLFTELEARNRDLIEALEQQTATAGILQVIAASPTDVQPVLDAVTRSAARLCDADDATVWSLEGERMRTVAHQGPIPFFAPRERPLGRGTIYGRSILERRAVQVTDAQAEGEDFPDSAALAKEFGTRTAVSAPLLREGEPIGAIVIRRREVRPFSERSAARRGRTAQLKAAVGEIVEKQVRLGVGGGVVLSRNLAQARVARSARSFA